MSVSNPPTRDAFGETRDMSGSYATATPDNLYATIDPAGPSFGEGFGRQIAELPIGVLPFAALGIAGDGSRPVSQHPLQRCVAGVDVAMHDRNQGTSTGGKHRAETILERALGIFAAA